ncbi:MAG: hypothetical protein WD894_01090 [Pirellulales bacterium]
MKKLFRLLIVVAIVIVAVGFYRGWFALSSPDGNDGSNKVNVNLTMDRDKIKDDAKAVKEKSAELTENVIGGEKNSADRPANHVETK